MGSFMGKEAAAAGTPTYQGRCLAAKRAAEVTSADSDRAPVNPGAAVG